MKIDKVIKPVAYKIKNIIEEEAWKGLYNNQVSKKVYVQVERDLWDLAYENIDSKFSALLFNYISDDITSSEN